MNQSELELHLGLAGVEDLSLEPNGQGSDQILQLGLTENGPELERVLSGAHPKPAKAPAKSKPPRFWLEGNAIFCACPDCGAPMSVRLWLLTADCWRCGISIELTEDQRRAVEALQQAATSEPVANPVSVAASPPPETARHESPTKPRWKDESEPEIGKRTEVATSPKAPVEAIATAKASPVTLANPEPASPPPITTRPTLRLENRKLKAIPWWRALPAWLISFLAHLAAIMILALITLGVSRDVDEWVTLSVQVSRDRTEAESDRDDQAVTAKFDVPDPDQQPDRPKTARLAIEADAKSLQLDPNEEALSLAPLEVVRGKIGSANGVRGGFAARDPRLRSKLIEKEGGTSLTEAAVARGLRWLARHQSANGSWSLHEFHRAGNCSCGGRGHIDDDTAGTALALLPFLGAGQTHLVGLYQETVSGGLRWLITKQKPDGDLRSAFGNSGMYAQGQAAIVLCEAFAMTGDEDLRAPSQKAIDFIVQAQYTDGGWRYTPTDRSQPSDTSVVGWQIMALQSARVAGLTVPERTFSRAYEYLDRVSLEGGAIYSYQQHQGASPVMTAEALLCRIYMGWTREQLALGRGIEAFSTTFPPSRDNPNIYYWYYATQTMHHYGGPRWESWNLRMRDVLVESQITSGHAAGSWSPKGEHADTGGRVYMTALAVCTLEVYYRHLPIFRKIDVE